MIVLILAAILLMFVAVVFVGAPYVPTHKKAIESALDILQLKKGDLIVDLGSGDGAVLIAAAKRGYRAAGYEINPVLWLISKIRCARFGRSVSVELRDFRLNALPGDASAVFVFTAAPYVGSVARYLKKASLNRTVPLVVVSYGFELPGMKATKRSEGINVYRLG